MYVLWGLFQALGGPTPVSMLGQTLEAGEKIRNKGASTRMRGTCCFSRCSRSSCGLLLNWKNGEGRLGSTGLIWWWCRPRRTVGGRPVRAHPSDTFRCHPGGAGPLLWILAVIFSTLGILNANSERDQQPATSATPVG